jgi:hypothetical protein
MKKNGKVFCISYQRTGTTSTGHFLRNLGYNCVGWETAANNKWPEAWHDGDFESIFNSPAFLEADAFEDAPWFFPGFFKQLYHRHPGARFILLHRDLDKWFESMRMHSRGYAPGEPSLHAKVYRREIDYLQRLSAAKPDQPIRLELTGCKARYQALYQLHLIEATDFFKAKAPHALFFGALKDPEIWSKMANFLGSTTPIERTFHFNQSKGRRAMPEVP